MRLGDAAATAANISGNRELFRLGFTLYLVEMSAQIAMTIFFYQLLNPVDRGVALLSTVFGLVGWLAFLWPPLGYRLFLVIALLGLVGSMAMIGWLLVRAIDEPRWLEQARAAASSVWR